MATGTGKTTTLRALLDLLDRHGSSYVLASPTGRAAKRMEEATGRESRTIHRLLEFNPRKQRFERDGGRPLEADLVIGAVLVSGGCGQRDSGGSGAEYGSTSTCNPAMKKSGPSGMPSKSKTL